MMINILIAIDFMLKQYIVIGSIVALGLVVLLVAFTVVKSYRDKSTYENESLPSLVEVGLADFEEVEEEDNEDDRISAFDFEDEEESSFQDDSANSILADANRTTQIENERRTKQRIGLFGKNKSNKH